MMKRCRWLVFAILMAGSVTAIRSAVAGHDCHIPKCQIQHEHECHGFRWKKKKIYEKQVQKCVKTICEPVCEEQKEIRYKNITETRYKECKYTVEKPVYETVMKECRYTVSKPVRETTYKEVRYTVCKPVKETTYKIGRAHV